MALKSKFCARCGEQTSLTDGFCSECYFETHTVSVPKRKELRVCSKCGAVLIGRFWVLSHKSNKDIFAEQVKLAVRTPEALRIVRVDLLKVKADGAIELTFELNGCVFSREYRINLSINKQVCPICKNNLAKNKRGRIQLRTTGSFQKFIREMLEYLSKYSKHIVEVEELRTGLDVSIPSRIIGLKIARDLKQKFNFYMRESREEYSWDRSKNRPKYKSTILLKTR